MALDKLGEPKSAGSMGWAVIAMMGGLTFCDGAKAPVEAVQKDAIHIVVEGCAKQCSEACFVVSEPTAMVSGDDDRE
ncbi:hypothetical protein JKY72_01345 [Candidatus Gracilibacteria bacterium]|nr:hypothetical protein [Candidatus Gracilibacteria bacterium]